MFGLGPVKGSFGLGSATINIVDPPEASTVEATLPASSFSTRNPLRDGDVRSRHFLDAKRHPVISFRSESVAWRGGAWHVAGQLVVKERSAPLELRVDELTTNEGTLTLRATGEVDRYAHGITAMKGMAAQMLSFEITAEGPLL